MARAQDRTNPEKITQVWVVRSWHDISKAPQGQLRILVACSNFWIRADTPVVIALDGTTIGVVGVPSCTRLFVKRHVREVVFALPPNFPSPPNGQDGLITIEGVSGDMIEGQGPDLDIEKLPCRSYSFFATLSLASTTNGTLVRSFWDVPAASGVIPSEIWIKQISLSRRQNPTFSLESAFPLFEMQMFASEVVPSDQYELVDVRGGAPTIVADLNNLHVPLYSIYNDAGGGAPFVGVISYVVDHAVNAAADFLVGSFLCHYRI